MSVITCQALSYLLFIIVLPLVQFNFVVVLTILSVEGTHENDHPQAALQSETNGSNEVQVYLVNNDISSTQTSFYGPYGKVSKLDQLLQTKASSKDPDLKLIIPEDQSDFVISDTLKKDNFSDKRSKRSDSVSVTKPEDHPYAVLLFIFDRSEYLGCCSGSLVSMEWILTAASHCFSVSGVTVSHVQVYAGGNSEHEWLKKTYPPGYQLRNSSRYHVHPEYSREEFYVSYYDVALVKVEKFLKSRTVSPVQIHGRSWDFDSYIDCTLTGFGKHQFYEERDDDYVRKTYRLLVKSPCPCLNSSKAIYRNWICSKPMKDFGICGSDWGASLVCNNQIRAVAVVVISYKDLNTCKQNNYDQYLCTQDGSLSIFQNIFPCIKWMNSYLQKFVSKPIHSHTPNKARKQQSEIFIFFIALFTITFST